MTVRNLDALFRPRSIAVIGAGTRAGSVGAVLARNLLSAGFAGPVMPVHPRERAINGVYAYHDVASLPETPDLAVLVTPPPSIPDLVGELGRRGTRAAVVITAGFGEGGDEEGYRLRQATLDAARPHLLRIVGPNCLGIMVPASGVNASFAHLSPQTGGVAFVTQSGALVTSVLDWAVPRGIGFSHLVSLGDMADVDFGDMLDYLATDSDTRAILLYIEAVTDARKFMSAARAAARVKPVIAVKAGRFAEAAQAAASHTGALAGVDAVYDAAFTRAGVLRVFDMVELFDAVETLSRIRRVEGDRLAILTNGGGIGVLAMDSLIAAGGRPARLSPETVERLDRVLPPTWSRANPVDIIGDATGSRYADALEGLLEDRDADAILVLNCPTAVASSVEAADAVISVARRRPHDAPPLLTSWVGEQSASQARRMFAENGLATYATPGDAVRAFSHVVKYRRMRSQLMEAPPSLPEQYLPDRSAVRRIIDGALADGREWLNEQESKQVLSAYTIPTVPTEIACSPEDAAAAAERMGGSIALKILSPDILHKTDVQGVALNLDGPKQVEAAARTMLDRVAQARPEARITGFTVQQMIRRASAHEIIVGMIEDVQFGPVILFGRGGTAVEVANDKALALPPLNLKLAHEQIESTQISRFLDGYRGRRPANREAIAATLVRISQLVCDFAEIVELDVNPLLADEAGVIALDARVRIRATQEAPHERLAIQPYPSELEERVTLENGREFLLRPVRAEDAAAFHRGFARLDADDIRMRFFAPMGRLSAEIMERLTQIDYDREMAIIAVAPGDAEAEEVFGVVRIIADPDNRRAEYAVIVDSAIKGQGLGRILMERIIAHARRRGIGEIWGDVLRGNHRMLHVCEELGFRREAHPEEREAVRVVLTLDPAVAGRSPQASSRSSE